MGVNKFTIVVRHGVAPIMIADPTMPYWGDDFAEQQDQEAMESAGIIKKVGYKRRAYDALKGKEQTLTAREDMQHRINDNGC